MTIAASAVARVVGIETQFKDLRGGQVLFLPQRIAVFAQGSSAVSYPTTKWTSTGANAAGSRFGFGSPIHLALLELQPINGDGVGTIPVDVFPLSDHASGAPATGEITPSGTATEAFSAYVRVSGYLSEAFTIAAGAVTTTGLTAACRAMADALNAVLKMPVDATFDYGTVTGTKTTTVGTSNGTIGTLSVTGNPVPGNWTLECTAEASNAGTFKLTDPDGVVVSTSLTVGVSNAGGIQFTVTDGAEDFDVGDKFTIVVPATKVNCVSKWEGLSANDLYIEIFDANGDAPDFGVTFAITQPTGGLNNPTLDAQLAAVGNVWETMALNAMNPSDTVALNTIKTFGEGRWGELVHKPILFFYGNTDADVADAIAIPDARKDDRVNVQLVNPGSVQLPFVVAARQLARIAVVANTNPARDYGSQRATGLVPGDDADQWDYAVRDLAVKGGSSTVEVKDGVVNISDTVTHWHPTGEDPPAYRYVCDVVKLQNIIYNLALRFATSDWDGAPLIPDDQPTVNPDAKQPKMARAELSGLIDSLADEAIISDPETAKESSTAAINSMNPKRLDVGLTVMLSGNTNIIPVSLNFGFFFGA